jgi:hypothetical protein
MIWMDRVSYRIGGVRGLFLDSGDNIEASILATKGSAIISFQGSRVSEPDPV